LISELIDTDSIHVYNYDLEDRLPKDCLSVELIDKGVMIDIDPFVYENRKQSYEYLKLLWESLENDEAQLFDIWQPFDQDGKSNIQVFVEDRHLDFTNDSEAIRLETICICKALREMLEYLRYYWCLNLTGKIRVTVVETGLKLEVDADLSSITDDDYDRHFGRMHFKFIDGWESVTLDTDLRERLTLSYVGGRYSEEGIVAEINFIDIEDWQETPQEDYGVETPPSLPSVCWKDGF
tara:strand:+ start:22935 stop:23645 length:711 start_codon:yes stop_codon:yes gene_type:complete